MDALVHGRHNFPPRLRKRLAKLNLSEDHILNLLKSYPFVPLDAGDGRFWTIVFENDPELADQGYFITGRKLGGGWEIEEVHPADVHTEEKNYFRQVAELNELSDTSLIVKNGFENCHDMLVRASTQVKLWLKHRLGLVQIVDLFAEDKIQIERDFSHRSRHERYSFTGQSHGRLLRAVVAVEPECHQTLVTAFERN